jgi:hypothetical protein
MGSFIGKLLNSSGTLAILAVVALSIWVSNLDMTIAVPKKVEGRPIEEIIQGTPNNIKDEPWDKDFKSAIVPIANHKGLR